MNREAYRLFSAGPVNVSDRVKKSMSYSEIGHREPEFSALLKDIREKLLIVFGANFKSTNYSIVIVNGSGTAALESVLISSVHDGKKILVVSNGAFGERLAEICRVYGLELNHLSYEWGDYPSLKTIERVINEDKDLESVGIVLLETSTGMLNPIHDVGALCKKYDKLFIVDAISGLGGEYLNVVDDNIDFCISNTNKCISGLPVLAFVCAKKPAIERIRDIKPRGFYLDFIKHYEYEETLNQTPYTPQIPLFFMAREAIDEMIEEGIENRIKRYHDNSVLLRERLESIGFKFQLNRGVMSNVLINVLVPRNHKFDEIHDKLKEKGYIIYPGKGPLKDKVMHIANIGVLGRDDVLEFCSAFESILGGKKIEY